MASTLSRDKLEGEERERRLREEVPYWQQASGRDAIQRSFTFKDFKEAWRFMSLTADKAEAVRVASSFCLVALRVRSDPSPTNQMDHHPEWFNVYNRVEVTLATHTCHGVSAYDIELAKAMDQFALQAAEESAAAKQ